MLELLGFTSFRGFTSFSFAQSEDAAVFGAEESKIDLITADVRLLPETASGPSRRSVSVENSGLSSLLATPKICSTESQATVVQKPVKPDELAAAVEQVLDHQS